MTTKKINRKNLAALLSSIASGGTKLLAPVTKAGSVKLSDISNFNDIQFDYVQTTLSPKSVVFPRSEILMSYELEGGKTPTIKQNETLEQKVVVFGLHPCDAYGMNYLEEFFVKENPDYHVARRKENTTFIALSCSEGDEYCFCTSVGISPSDTRGSDILLTAIGNDEYYTEVITDKGQKLIDEYPNLFDSSESVDKNSYTANIPKKFELDNVQGKLSQVFESDLWKESSLSCLGCGACAFLCPTCTCFDIQDEQNPYGGMRLRNWDSCGTGLFTLHASGHNPRPVQSLRWRQRVMHKLDYSVKNLGMVSCVGCGRCVRNCPAGMNIVEQILCIQEA